ncbi:carbohydrate ABC transporter permease [Alicyclobacillus mali (ex Roth et al. 2021)]|nr:carbohydrate ABC transporter permease [Alicyclobacillus mali (ex Roth et al. 2021)]
MRTIGHVLRAALALALGLAFLLPIYISFVTSLDRPQDVFVYPPHLVPDWNFSVWVQTWRGNTWMLAILNTVVIALATIAIALTTTVLCAYALVYIPFRGKAVVWTALLAVLMIPEQALLIPNFVTMAKLHLVDTRIAQIIPYGASIFGVFLLRQHLLTLPREYHDAAKIDGCGHLAFLWRIVLPLSRPILFTVALYIFIGCWNSLIWPLMVTSSPRVQPIEVLLSTFLTQDSSNWQGLSAAAMFATLPMIALFVLFRKPILRGLSKSSGING